MDIALLKDALQGDIQALKRPEIASLNLDNVRAALKWLTENKDLDPAYLNLLAEEGWRLTYKVKPPTPEEYLTDKWIGGQAESLWPHIRATFLEFMNPDPMNPERKLALVPSIGWGKQQPISSNIVVGKTIDIELENGEVLHIPSDKDLEITYKGKPLKIKANELLSLDLNEVEWL